jgi:hypothetical protein
MPKTTNKKKHTPAITKRFLLIMDETIKEGKCESEADFLTSIGEHRTNLYAYQNGTRSPTLEQVATTCLKYNYAPTWLILGTGDKKMSPKNQKTIEDRVSELEVTVAALKNQVRRK